MAGYASGTVLLWPVGFVVLLQFHFSHAILFDDPRSCTMTMVADVPTPLRSGESVEKRRTVEEMLDFYWKGTDAYKEKAGREYTYGEITAEGVRQLLQSMGLGNDDTADVFYDAGSGVGRLVAQLYLEHRALNVIGVELSKQRHDMAVESWQRLQESVGESTEQVRFLNEDVLETDFSDATHIYLSSLCFPRDVIDAIQVKLITCADAGNLRVVAALSDLTLLEHSENQRWAKHQKEIRMTWGGSRVRIYKLLSK